jgi:predicted MFS family arabinose efflux permease
VFLLVAATFSTIYLTQPVLPVLREEFGVDAAKASLTVSAVIFGIALVAVLLVIPVAAGILEARLDRPGSA